ncbi:hypothetical protein K0M31_007562 [Melipona bicolor]|uniref:Uncharacterized protein n=1 Tax=Melipona bicolor TaxID=60889 RepID=A0AA40KVX7_9HYME|nr:hypothetical protein K0M31_007562 [Melipona bicolor]
MSLGHLPETEKEEIEMERERLNTARNDENSKETMETGGRTMDVKRREAVERRRPTSNTATRGHADPLLFSTGCFATFVRRLWRLGAGGTWDLGLGAGGWRGSGRFRDTCQGEETVAELVPFNLHNLRNSSDYKRDTYDRRYLTTSESRSAKVTTSKTVSDNDGQLTKQSFFPPINKQAAYAFGKN